MPWFFKKNQSMEKKKYPDQKSNKVCDTIHDHVLDYTFPVYHDRGEKSYVDFYYFEPVSNIRKRKKYHLDSIKSKRERKLHAQELIKKLLQKLRDGWLPCHDDTRGSKQYELFEDCLALYLKMIEGAARRKTFFVYNSRVNVLREFMELKKINIKYIYQFDDDFCFKFMDYIRFDRNLGPRTINNYRNWLFSLCEFFIKRKFIDTNPVEKIDKMKEPKKRRTDLSPEMLRRMQSHLQQTDRHFLLACLFEYFTFIRPNELSYLKIGDINIKESKIFVNGKYSKNGKDSFVGLNDTIIKLMVELGTFDNPNDFYIFGKNFKPSAFRYTPDQFNRRFAQMRKEFGWPDTLVFYSLKDSGIRDLANDQGAVVARDQARHSDISTTNKYIQGRGGKVHEETKHFTGSLK